VLNSGLVAMLDDDERGPTLAALWFLQYLSGRIDGACFSAATLASQLERQGFESISAQVVIAEITKLVVCAKPGAPARETQA